MPRSLVDMIRLYTGYDATTEPAFEIAALHTWGGGWSSPPAMRSMRSR